MQVDTSGQHMSVGQSLNEYVDGRLKEVVGKYFSNAPSAHVHFSKQGHEFKCDIVLHEGTGRHVVITLLTKFIMHLILLLVSLKSKCVNISQN